MPVSLARIQRMRCPTCEIAYNIEIWMVVDAHERPDLWSRCKDGSIHTCACPNGHRLYLSAPLLLHDHARRWVVFSPGPGTNDRFDHMHQAQFLVGRLQSSLPPTQDTSYLQMVSVITREELPKELEAGPDAEDAGSQEDDNWEPEELRSVISELSSPTAPAQYARRLRLCEMALQRTEKARNASLWAFFQDRLATLLHRMPGRRAEELDRSIDARTAALTVFSVSDEPKTWADAQLNLGCGYLERGGENRQTDDLLRSVAASDAALTVFTQQDSPSEWAMATANRRRAMALLDMMSVSQEQADSSQDDSSDCRQEATPTDTVSHSPLATIIQEFNSPQLRNATPRRIELLTEALRLCPRQRDEPTWAALQLALGNEFMNLASTDRRDQLDGAINAFAHAAAAAENADNPKLLMAALCSLGTAYLQRAGGEGHDIELAIQVLEGVVARITMEAAPGIWARAYANLGNAYSVRMAGNHTDNIYEAVRAFKHALQVFTPGMPEWTQVQIDLGVTCAEAVEHNIRDHVETGIAALTAALEFLTREESPVRWGWAHIRLAELHEHRGAHHAQGCEAAIRSLQSALTVFDKNRATPQWLRIQIKLASAYAHRFEGDRIANLERALAIRRDVAAIYRGKEGSEGWAKSQWDLGIAFIDCARKRPEYLPSAKQRFEAALRFFTRESHPYDWALIQGELGQAYAMSVDESAEANTQKAIECFEGAVSVLAEPRSFDPTTNLNLAVFQMALAQAYLRLAHLDATYRDRSIKVLRLARSNAEASLTNPRAAYDAGRHAGVLWTLGKALLDGAEDERSRLVELTEAVAVFEEALRVISRVTVPSERRVYLESLAKAQSGLGRWEDAYATLQLARRDAEAVYSSAVNDTNREQEIRINTGIYSSLVEASLRLPVPRPLEAFVHAEDGRSRILRDQLATLSLPVPKSVPPELVSREGMLLNELRAFGAQMPAEKRDEIQRELQALWSRFERHFDAVGYVALRRGEPTDWEAIQRWLVTHQRPSALMEFFQCGDQLLAFLVRQGQSEPKVIPIDLSIDRLGEYAARLITEVHHFSPEDPRTETWLQMSSALLSKVMPHLDGVELLYIVPFGRLHEIPLHALEYLGQPLIQHFAIAYAPSVAVAIRATLRGDELRRMSGQSTRLVVGDPLGDLPYAAEEALVVSERIGAQLILGAHATRKHVVAQLPNSEYAHFATHALFDPEDPFSSGLLLAGDERLTGREVLELSLRARLIVLSGCKTGLQEVRTGEELAGLARAYLYAGSPSLVMSLWEVNDSSTKQLMKEFYDGLHIGSDDKGASAAESLRQAMLSVRADKPNTFYWAPFVLYGDWR